MVGKEPILSLIRVWGTSKNHEILRCAFRFNARRTTVRLRLNPCRALSFKVFGNSHTEQIRNLNFQKMRLLALPYGDFLRMHLRDAEVFLKIDNNISINRKPLFQAVFHVNKVTFI
jgi:hypothetical protein